MTYAIFGANTSGHDYFVGDLHGCYDDIMSWTKKINFDFKKDRLFCTGDLVDRGPDSMGCLRLIMEPWFFSVRGNHEDLAMSFLEAEEPEELQRFNWQNNGASWYFLKEQDYDAEEIIALINKMPYALEVETRHGTRVGVVHAEPFKDWNKVIEEAINVGDESINMLWSRHKYFNRDETHIENIDWVFVGHTPVRGEHILGNVQYIDYGMVFKEGREPLQIHSI